MTFEIKGKVALVSGGASGIGFSCVKELLRNGLRGVVLADISEAFGVKAVKEINEEFGTGKVIFIKTDVSNKDSYEDAFKKTIEEFKNLDILINNAGILNEQIWEREIQVNLVGMINGMLLALENYIPKYRTSGEGVIVNLSSIAGIGTLPSIPIYSSTKFAARGLTLTFGHQLHYKRTNVKVLALCPGTTDTGITVNLDQKVLGPDYYVAMKKELAILPIQSCAHVGKSLIKVIETARSGTIWVVEGEKEAYEFLENANRSSPNIC